MNTTLPLRQSRSNFFKLFLGLSLLIVISMDRNLIFSYYLFDKESIKYFSSFILFITLFIIFLNLAVKRKLFYNRYHSYLVILLLICSVYFALHEIFFEDYLRAMKYSVLLLIALLILGIRVNFNFVP